MRTIDYRITTWGHNHYFEPTDNDEYNGPCWVTGSISVGDEILWKTGYGHAVAEVLSVRSYRDPSDMFSVRSKVIRRVANPNIVSQEELDKSFNGS